jgi:hypothetical protein
MTDDNSLLARMAAIGAAVGVAQVLMSKDPVTVRSTVGKAISNAVLAVSAAATLAVVPGLNPFVLTGISALVATLGTEGLQKLFQKYVNKE